MILKLPWYWYALAIMAIYIIFLKSCSSKCPTPTETVTVKHDTAYVKTTELSPSFSPLPIIITQRDTEYFQSAIDTNAIVKDYMFKRTYKDVIPNKYGMITIFDTIYQNKIENRQVLFDFKVPEITLTNTMKPKNKIYFGIDIGSNGSFISLGPQFSLVTKQDKMYWIGASYTSQSQLYYHFGAAWKLHF